jgi:hypothetical protein
LEQLHDQRDAGVLAEIHGTLGNPRSGHTPRARFDAAAGPKRALHIREHRGQHRIPSGVELVQLIAIVKEGLKQSISDYIDKQNQKNLTFCTDRVKYRKLHS